MHSTAAQQARRINKTNRRLKRWQKQAARVELAKSLERHQLTALQELEEEEELELDEYERDCLADEERDYWDYIISLNPLDQEWEDDVDLDTETLYDQYRHLWHWER